MRRLIPVLFLSLCLAACGGSPDSGVEMAPVVKTPVVEDQPDPTEMPPMEDTPVEAPIELPAPTAGPSLAELMATPQFDYQNARLEEAGASYEMLAELYPASPEPLLGLADLAERAGDDDAAYSLIQSALSVDLGCLDCYRRLAVHQERRENWEDLLETYSSLIEIEPDAELYRVRAIVEVRLGEIDGAISDLTMAESLDPYRTDGWIRAAGAAAAGHDYTGAIALIDAGLETISGDQVMFYEKALALISNGDGEAALAELDTLITLNPEHTGAHFWRGRLLAEAGDLEEALEEALLAYELGVDKGITDDVLAFEAAADAADLMTRLDDLTRAFEFVAEQVFIHGSRDELMLAYARIDWRRGSAEAALDRLAILVANGYPEAHYWRGVILAEEGKTAEAVTELTLFTELFPYGPKAEAAYSLLSTLG